MDKALLSHHSALIVASGILPEVAKARGYRSITNKADAMALGFADAQACVPALLVPVYGVDGHVATHQLRPDYPRIVNGKPIKYETPKGSHLAIDVPPGVRHLLGSPSVPLVITEGVRKADALASQAIGFMAQAVARHVCVVALLGVWNWRGKNENGGKTALPDWESIALNGRTVYICFDSDVMTKDAVREALLRLKAFLTSRSAKVIPLYLPPQADGNKQGVDDYLAAGGTLEDLFGLIAPPKGIGATSHASGFTFTTLDDLLAEPEEEIGYVWELTLPAGGTSIIAAKPKVGKSTLVRCLVLAILRGLAFFGRETAQGPVVYLCLEEKRAEVAAHFRRMGASGNDLHIHTGSAPDDAIAALASAITEYRPALVVIDPLSRFVRLNDANAYAEVARAMEPIIDLARTTGTHILLVHHAGKGERSGGDALLGSTALFGAVDTLLLMKKRENVRTLETINRYGADLPETVVMLDAESGEVTPNGDFAMVQLAQVKTAVLDAMGDDLLVEADIRTRVGGNESRTAKALRALIDEGKVVRTGEGKRGKPFHYQQARAGTQAENATADSSDGDTALDEPRTMTNGAAENEMDAHAVNPRFSRFTNRANQENRATEQEDEAIPEWIRMMPGAADAG